MNEGDTLNQTIYIKYKESITWDESPGKIVQITTIEEKKIDMIEGIGEEHIYESPKHTKKDQRKKANLLASPCVKRWMKKLQEKKKTCKEIIKPKLSYMQEE